VNILHLHTEELAILILKIISQNTFNKPHKSTLYMKISQFMLGIFFIGISAAGNKKKKFNTDEAIHLAGKKVIKFH
jgi:hypothetical protein